MIKRLLITIIALGVIAGIASYFFLDFSSLRPSEETEAMAIKQVSEERVVSPVNSYNNDAVWFANQRGQLFRLNTLDNSVTEYPLPPLLDSTLHAIIWPSQGNDFLSVATDSFGESKRHYSDDDKQYALLPANVRSIDWLHNGRQIAMVWKSGDGTNKLVVANPDASGYKILADLPWEDLVVKTSPTDVTALLIKEKIEGEVNKIYLFSLGDGEYSELVAEGRNTAAEWSPDGSNFVYLRLVENNRPEVRYFNVLSRQDTKLDLDLASLDKVFFAADSRTLYAASGKADGTGDEFVKIDLINFSKETVYSPDQNIRVRNLLYVAGKIFYVNAQDGLLYTVE